MGVASCLAVRNAGQDSQEQGCPQGSVSSIQENLVIRTKVVVNFSPSCVGIVDRSHFNWNIVKFIKLIGLSRDVVGSLFIRITSTNKH